jgi:7-carboxy-7-deazaguanine synthase
MKIMSSPMSFDDKGVSGMPGKDWYVVNEVFTSVQGEGVFTGTHATFIRLQGCPVGCEWCDSGPLADLTEGRFTNGLTRNTWDKGGMRMMLKDIMQQIQSPHVIITGGEPLIWDLDALIKGVWARGGVVQVETSGWCDFKGKVIPEYITWSPKNNLQWDAPVSFKRRALNEIKWVVDSELTLNTVIREFEWQSNHAVTPFNPTPPVFCLMPEGSPPKPENIKKALQWLEEVPFAYRRDFRFSHRMQYLLGVR